MSGCWFPSAVAYRKIYTLSLHDALPIFDPAALVIGNVELAEGASIWPFAVVREGPDAGALGQRSEEHTSELQSLRHLVCRLLLEKKNGSILGSILPYASAPSEMRRRARR